MIGCIYGKLELPDPHPVPMLTSHIRRNHSSVRTTFVKIIFILKQNITFAEYYIYRIYIAEYYIYRIYIAEYYIYRILHLAVWLCSGSSLPFHVPTWKAYRQGEHSSLPFHVPTWRGLRQGERQHTPQGTEQSKHQ